MEEMMTIEGVVHAEERTYVFMGKRTKTEFYVGYGDLRNPFINSNMRVCSREVVLSRNVLFEEVTSHKYEEYESIIVDGEEAKVERILRDPKSGKYIVHTNIVIENVVDECSKKLAELELEASKNRVHLVGYTEIKKPWYKRVFGGSRR